MKDNNDFLQDKEIDILIPRDEYGNYSYGLFDYLVEKPEKGDNRSLAVTFGSLYMSNKNCPKEVAFKISDAFVKLGIGKN